MSKVFAACASFVVVGLFAAAGVRASAPSAAEKDVSKANAELVTAVLKRDASALDRLMADDLLYVHGDGQQRGKKAFIEELGKHLTYNGIELSDEKVRAAGDLAVLSARAKFKVFEHGHDAEKLTHITRVFTKKSGKWQLSMHQATLLPAPAPAKK